jgi:hypothetical protein
MRLIHQDLTPIMAIEKSAALQINWLSNQPRSISIDERNSNAERKTKKPSKTYVKYESISKQPFEVLEMDIKFV